MLYSLFVVMAPAAIILIGVTLYSNYLFWRYRRTIARLYKMNFNSLETERKRIANDLHDQLGAKLMVMQKSLEHLEDRVGEEESAEVNKVQSELRVFHKEIRLVLEAIHPRDLMEGNWRKALERLATELCVEGTSVSVEFHTDKDPKPEHRYQLYRVVQEKLSNIFSHSDTNRVQIQINEDDQRLYISLVYRKNKTMLAWLGGKLPLIKGRGSLIINDRLDSIKAKKELKQVNGFIMDTISVDYENPTTR